VSQRPKGGTVIPDWLIYAFIVGGSIAATILLFDLFMDDFGDAGDAE
jgi:hypothetical protein